MRTKRMDRKNIRIKEKTSFNIKRSFNDKMMKYVLCYSAIFIILYILSFFSLYINGKSFIWNEDGINQHYNALVYYGNWLRQIMHIHAESGKWVIPQWDLNLGHGMDIIDTLHYYVIGEPINILSYFVSPENTEHLYNFLVFLRLYLSGLAFSAFCFYKGKKKEAVFIGSLMYALSGYAVCAVTRHPFFVTPMIWFPLILLGVDKILKEKKPFLFITMVCMASLSNFYFFYMIVLGIVMYVILRFFMEEHSNFKKDLIKTVFQFAVYGFCGTLMSMATLYPILLTFFGTARTDVKQKLMAFYSLRYYESYLSSFMKSGMIGNWTIICVAAPAIFALFILFSKKKEYVHLKIAFLILTAFMLIPAVGYLFNGFSYVSNRWCWIYIMLIIYIFTTVWDDICFIKKRGAIFGLGGISLCSIVILSSRYGKSEEVFCTLFFMTFMLAALVIVRLLVSKEQLKNISFAIILLFASLNIMTSVHYRFDNDQGGNIQELIDAGTAYDLYKASGAKAVLDVNEGDYKILESETYKLLTQEEYDHLTGIDSNAANITDADSSSIDVTQLEDEKIFRYEQDEINVMNAGDLMGTPGTSYFWSIGNSDVVDFYSKMGLNNYLVHDIRNVNERAFLAALSNVKYYVRATDTSPVMFGYEKLGKVCMNADEAEDLIARYMAEMDLESIQKSIIRKKELKQNPSYFSYIEKTEEELKEEEQKESYFASLMQKLDEYLDTYTIYRNKYVLPLGYTYDSYITEEMFDQMSVSQRQEAILQGGLISGDQEELVESIHKKNRVSYTEELLDYEMIPDKGISIMKDGAIFVQNAGGKLRLNFEKFKNNDLYVTFQCDNVKPQSSMDLYNNEEAPYFSQTLWEERNKLQRNTVKLTNFYKDEHWYDQKFEIFAEANDKKSSVIYTTDYYQWNSNKDEYLLNLGYMRSNVDCVTLEFDQPGIYQIHDIKVIRQPMDLYKENLETLGQDRLQNITYETNTLQGDISLKKSKLLCISIPFDKGWTLLVDGEEKTPLKVNGMNIGTVLSKGKHHIEMIYETPGLKTGRILSFLGILLCIILCSLPELKKSKRYKGMHYKRK